MMKIQFLSANSRTKVFVILIIVFSFISLPLLSCAEPKNFCDTLEDSVPKDFKVAKTADACDAVYNKYQKCELGGEGENFLTGMKGECYKKIMNQELDKRLTSLKNTDKSQFSKEMRIQSSFNKSMDTLCESGSENGYGGTGWKIAEGTCRLSFYSFRLTQARNINSQSLDISCNKKLELNSRKSKNLDEYISGICSMPKEVWKDKTVPVDCKAKLRKCFHS